MSTITNTRCQKRLNENSVVGLRYYADAKDEDDHNQILQLLNQVEDRFGIEAEISRIDPVYSIQNDCFEITSCERRSAYVNDIHRNQHLRKTMGSPPSLIFGGQRDAVLRGRVGVTHKQIDSTHDVIWCAPSPQWRQTEAYSDQKSNHREVSHPIPFLKEILRSNGKVLSMLLESLSGHNTESKITSEFLKDEATPGVPEQATSEETIGPDGGYGDHYSGAGPRRVDTVIRGERRTWVVETKKKLTAGSLAKALGQCLLNRSILDNSEVESNTVREVRSVMVFGDAEFDPRRELPGTFETSLRLANRLGILLFIRVDDSFIEANKLQTE